MADSGYQVNSAYQEILERADIVQVIRTFIEVIPKGASYMAVCPFHDDTNPSMNISPSKRIFKCFSCGTGGNAISFVAKYRGISTRAAELEVCRICGIPVPDSLSRGTREPELDGPSRALDDLASFYRIMLRSSSGKRALDYLRGRGMTDDVIDRFGIGYAPRDPSLAIRSLREKKGHPVQDLERAGIISEGATELRDRYSERVMFPIRDARGHTVGFSGRVYLPDDHSTSKYINSPETKYFVKSRLLYNLDQAWEPAKRKGYIYLVEGFMDAIALARAGEEAAVAAMGTAFTEEHAAILRRLGVEVRVCLDSDAPGQANERKVADMLSDKGIRYRVVEPFPADEGKDADEVVRSSGNGKLLENLSRLLDPIAYRLQILTPGRIDLRQLDSMIERTAGDFAGMSPSERELCVQRIAELSGLKPEFIQSRFRESLPRDKGVVRAAERPRSNGSSFPALTVPKASERALGKPQVATAIRRRLPGEMRDVGNSGVVSYELDIAIYLSVSSGACQLFLEHAARTGDWLYVPVLRRIAEPILELSERGDIAPSGLTDEQRYSIELELREAAESGDEDLVNYTADDISSLLAVMSLWTNGDYDPQAFSKLLDMHRRIADSKLQRSREIASRYGR